MVPPTSPIWNVVGKLPG